MRPPRHLPARSAHPAGVFAAGRAQERLRERARHGQPPNAGGADEEVGVRDPATPERPLEEQAGVGLADEIAEGHPDAGGD